MADEYDIRKTQGFVRLTNAVGTSGKPLVMIALLADIGDFEKVKECAEGMAFGVSMMSADGKYLEIKLNLDRSIELKGGESDLLVKKLAVGCPIGGMYLYPVWGV